MNNQLIQQLIFSKDKAQKEQAYQEIRKQAEEKGIQLASIQDFYMAAGKGEVSNLTVPAINIRGLTYDTACTIFQAMKEKKVGALIFELARSEMGYTDQPPMEYAGVVLAAAIKEEHQGPVFIQGDHFQIKAEKYEEEPEETVNDLKEFIKEAIDAGFYNIDIDSSTLVDLSKSTVREQQENNYKVCAEFTKFIRENEPAGITVSVGGEIGEIGEKNSTPEELREFMAGYQEEVGDVKGISKMSVQTGTSHGGVVLPDGSIAEVAIDFDTLKELSKIAKEEYGLGGAVQHGASTLPDEAFSKFPETGTIEVHLATGFQNIVMDHAKFPQDLKEKMYKYLDENYSDERKEDQTNEQFYYKLRKKAWGPFKKECWDLSAEIKEPIMQELKDKFIFLFEKLNAVNTIDLVAKYIK